MFDRFSYPCCGYLVFNHQPESHSVCPICRWEDDLGQLCFPNMPGGANIPAEQTPISNTLRQTCHD